ncbi:ADP-ribosylation factor-binding protein GGA3 isoform X2 [Ambystoma mexicanum]|uniref:ADP-ribosylation factor-binding protein GGA3 isoform X2 n=1 Tax=Ambystoma mexicanum TaxID=8296 RepID=UPI0037E85A89
MAEAEGESLESWLNKATNPCNRQEDWEYIMGFCDQMNGELEGPQIAVRLLAHKIQSPQEWEAVQALVVLEACMKNCGRRFHIEVGKFRFLNELIKVVSPKYLGDRVSEKVKSKVVELLFSWTLALPEESKIKDAYKMLKRQGIVQSDPVIPVDRTLIPSPPARPKNPVFDDEEKSKLLAMLLKSKNPEDLLEANKLIKTMVKEDEVRMQKATMRQHTLEEVANNVKLLHEMLVHYSNEDSSEADKELMKELLERCELKRLMLFKMASETEDNDDSLGDILQASDNLSRVINLYKKLIEGQVINGETDLPTATSPPSKGCHPSSEMNSLIDLVGLEVSTAPLQPLTAAPLLLPPPPTDIPFLPPPPAVSIHPRSRSSSQKESTTSQGKSTGNCLSLLDEELLCLGLNDSLPGTVTEAIGSSQWTAFQNEQSDQDLLSARPMSSNSKGTLMPLLPQPFLSQSGAQTSASAPQTASSLTTSNTAMFLTTGASESPPENAFPSGALHELEVLGQQLLEEAKGSSSQARHSIATPQKGVPLSASAAPLVAPASVTYAAHVTPAIPIAVSSSGPAGPGSPVFQPLQQGSPLKGTNISLGNVHVPLECIKPSSTLPVTAYDKNGLRVLLHFASECPPGRPDVLVVVVSMLNTAPLPITNIVLQAAVPKSMKVKLQPPSGTELFAFNPIQPPAAITQVMLLANPLKEKLRLRYKLAFLLGDQPNSEVGEVDQFPDVETWGKL